MTRSALATLLCLGLCSVGQFPGLAAGSDTRDVVTDRISVTVVEIPVQVLRRGEPVRGLEAADFEVYDRGVAQRIVSFDVLDLTGPVGSEAPEPAAEATGGSATREARSRHLLLLIDIDFTDWRELPRALRGARELIGEQLHPTDRVAVGFFSSFFGIQLLTPFTADRQAGLVAVEVIDGLVARRPQVVAQKLSELSELTGLTYDGEDATDDIWLRVARQWITTAQQPIGESPGELFAEAERGDAASSSLAYSETNLDPVTTSVEAVPDYYDEPRIRQVRELGRKLRDLARNLAHIPDPKHLIFLSQGFPSSLLQSRDQSTRVLFRLDTAVKAFLETGWILQAIDVRGVPSIEEPVFDGNSLFHLAEHTGGQLYENFNRIGAATERILARSSVTYLLVIQPDVEADGSFHKLEVRLKDDRAAKLSYRPGYRAPRPGDRRAKLDTRRDVAHLVLEGAPIEDFQIDLLAMAVPAIGGRARVPVVVEIPGEPLLENPFGDTASLEVHAYGLDSGRGIQDLFIKRLDIDLGRESKRLARGGLRFIGHLDLGEGDNEVRVLVRNLANDALSMSSAVVKVERLAAGDLAVLPPMFIDRSRDWLSLQLNQGGAVEQGTVATIAGIGAEFFPRLQPSFRGGRAQEVIVNLFFEAGREPRLMMRVLTARGQEVETPKIRLLNRWVGEGGATGLLATLQAKGLEPGGYTLEISIVDPASGARATSSQRFKIVESS